MSADNTATEPIGKDLTMQWGCPDVSSPIRLKLTFFTYQGHFDQMSDGDKLEGGGEVRVGGHDGHRGEDGCHRNQARLQVAKLGPLLVRVRASSRR